MNYCHAVSDISNRWTTAKQSQIVLTDELLACSHQQFQQMHCCHAVRDSSNRCTAAMQLRTVPTDQLLSCSHRLFYHVHCCRSVTDSSNRCTAGMQLRIVSTADRPLGVSVIYEFGDLKITIFSKSFYWAPLWRYKFKCALLRKFFIVTTSVSQFDSFSTTFGFLCGYSGSINY